MSSTVERKASWPYFQVNFVFENAIKDRIYAPVTGISIPTWQLST